MPNANVPQAADGRVYYTPTRLASSLCGGSSAGSGGAGGAAAGGGGAATGAGGRDRGGAGAHSAVLEGAGSDAYIIVESNYRVGAGGRAEWAAGGGGGKAHTGVTRRPLPPDPWTTPASC